MMYATLMEHEAHRCSGPWLHQPGALQIRSGHQLCPPAGALNASNTCLPRSGRQGLVHSPKDGRRDPLGSESVKVRDAPIKDIHCGASGLSRQVQRGPAAPLLALTSRLPSESRHAPLPLPLLVCCEPRFAWTELPRVTKPAAPMPYNERKKGMRYGGANSNPRLLG